MSGDQAEVGPHAGLQEDVRAGRARLARVAEYVRQNPAHLSLHVLSVSYGNLPRHEAVATFAADLAAAPCPYVVTSGEGTQHCTLAGAPGGLWARLGSEFHEEANAGHGTGVGEEGARDCYECKRIAGVAAAGPGGGLDREAAEALVRQFAAERDQYREGTVSWRNWNDAWNLANAALAPLLTGGGDGGE